MRTLSIIHYSGLAEIWKVSHNNQAKLWEKKTAESGSKKLLLMERNNPSKARRNLFCFFIKSRKQDNR